MQLVSAVVSSCKGYPFLYLSRYIKYIAPSKTIFLFLKKNVAGTQQKCLGEVLQLIKVPIPYNIHVHVCFVEKLRKLSILFSWKKIALMTWTPMVPVCLLWLIQTHFCVHRKFLWYRKKTNIYGYFRVLFYHENVCCLYSLELSHCSDSNEYT